MLSEISQGSKRMGKLKKYKSKVKESGFEFLLQSLERDKENHAPNHLTAHGNLSHSIQIDPLLTAPVNSFTLNAYPNSHHSNKPSFYLQNVKLLDRSDISVPDNNLSNPSRKSRKGRECSKGSSKSRNGKREKRNGSGKSKMSDNEQLQQLIYKIKQYLSITDDILNDIDISRWKYGKKAKTISKELVSMITALQSKNGMNHSVKTTSFNMYGSQILPSNGSSSPFVKRINGLQVQREKLHSLISQHQMANIKMYIKMNEGQSEEIQQCKKQLALLFEKYKKLQAYIHSDKKKMNEMLNEKEKMAKRCEELTQQNAQLLTMIEKSHEAMQKQHKSRKQRDNLAPIRVSMLRADSHLRQNSYPSFLDNSNASKGQLRIQSLQNSCNQSRFQDEIMPLSSSITTSTSRVNKKGGRLGINLNSLLQNLTQNQVQRIAQDPQRLKIMMRQCKQTILRMESIITEQNKELELSIKTLEEMKEQIKHKDDEIMKLEEKMAQLRQSQKEMSKKRKENKCNFNDSQSKGKRGKKQEKKVQVDDKGKVTIDLSFKKTKYDQYRIIAMQALALEQAISNQRIR